MSTPHLALRVIRDEHAALAAMLLAMRQMIERGPQDDAPRFFEVLRAMLFYIDEFPERLHHPKESSLLFPRVARRTPALMDAIARLERDHLKGEVAVRELMHKLIAWELLGDGCKEAFIDSARRYLDFYVDHMRLEEEAILPEAEAQLTEADWKELDAAFAENQDPLTGQHVPSPAYEKLFTRIVSMAPSPIGVG
ncbi:MAG TPA: hemerythrin domain-containing protein [Burkholderiaceae bacterium]|jgi:hemerythrin-like domain-containing protein|nr:hemerythrin domain-containing protein [Burkholderiaceae bacterium]